jgi:hypothetical protein
MNRMGEAGSSRCQSGIDRHGDDYPIGAAGRSKVPFEVKGCRHGTQRTLGVRKSIPDEMGISLRGRESRFACQRDSTSSVVP